LFILRKQYKENKNCKQLQSSKNTQTETDACPVVQLVHRKKQVYEEKGMERHTNIHNEYGE